MKLRVFLGGTFDPVHNGHIHAAHAVIEKLGVSSVSMVLSARPPHRGVVAKTEDRWKMLCLAVEDDEVLDISDVELEREGPSYTIDTLEGLEEDGPVVWVLGSDAIETFESWYRCEAFPNHCHVIVLARPGVAVRTLPGFRTVTDMTELVREQCGCLLVLQAPMLEVSATKIREMLSNGDDVSGLLPSGVWSYIKKRGLY